MTESTSLRISTMVLVMLIGTVFFAGKPQLSSAQNEGFQSYQLLVFCGDSSLAAAIFWYEMPPGGGTVGRPLMGLKTVCAGKKCSGGPVTLADALAQFPANVSSAMQSKVDSHQEKLGKEGWFLTCLGDEKKPEKKCEKPAPWFGGVGSSNCRDLQSPKIEINQGEGSVKLSFCGATSSTLYFFVPTDYIGGVDGYKTALAYQLQKRIGSKVCCDRWREAVRTGVPCDPSKDVDCDGKLDFQDIYDTKFGAVLPDINNVFTSSEGAPIDPFPPGLNPDDVGFFPPQDKCDCKWELMKGTLNCSPDGKQRHFYQARWRCPSTGNERFTRKEAPATAECDPPDRKAGTSLSQLMFLLNRDPMFPLSGVF